MDTKDELKKEDNAEDVDEGATLDEMMAQSVPSDEVLDETKEATVVTENETVGTAQDSVTTSEETVRTTDETIETPTKTENGPETDIETLDDSDADEGESTDTTEDKTVIEEAKPETKTVGKTKVVYRGKWYIVHTYSGHENKVAKTLMQRVQAMGFEERIFDALVPTRDTIRVRGGKKETIKEKIFPGYILVNMELSDEAWVLVRTTPGVTSFVGAQNKPTPIRDDEVEAIVAFVGQKDPIYKAQFSVGEAVKITDGPFSDFLGTVESIDDAKGKVKVLVSIFGRETPVELDFLQVAKI